MTEIASITVGAEGIADMKPSIESDGTGMKGWQSRLFNRSILFKSVLWAGVMLSSHLSMAPVWAAERLTVRIGPIERSIQVSHLEKFVETGKLSDDLELFEPLLGETLREALGSRLDIDPNIADTIFDDLLATPAGDRLLKALMLALPENTVEVTIVVNEEGDRVLSAKLP